MRKVSKLRSPDRQAPMFEDGRPVHVAGASITAGPGPRQIDVAAFFARPERGAPERGATVAGAGSAVASNESKTVSLADGAEIPFATPAEFTAVVTV